MITKNTSLEIFTVTLMQKGSWNVYRNVFPHLPKREVSRLFHLFATFVKRMSIAVSLSRAVNPPWRLVPLPVILSLQKPEKRSKNTQKSSKIFKLSVYTVVSCTGTNFAKDMAFYVPTVNSCLADTSLLRTPR